MKIRSQLTQERIKSMAGTGYWPDRVLTDYVDEAAAEFPDKVAISDLNSMTGGGATVSYRQLQRLANRIGLGLVSLGVEPGDIVSCQLPNWWQFAALHLACVRIGAVTNPIMPIFRHRELRFMLGLAETKVMVAPRVFRNFDYPEMMRQLRPDLPCLKQVLVLGAEGPQSFEQALLARRWEQEMDGPAIFRERQLQPNDVVQLLYTSGTTGDPKGVMHTSNTLLADIVQAIRRLDLSQQDVMFMPSPLAHQTGFALGMVLPLVLRAKCVLQDIWNPEVALQRIQDEGATFTMAATPFLADVTDSPVLEKYDVSTLRMFASGGAPIPRALVQRATQRLKASIISVWGMTENCVVTSVKPGDAEEKAFETDGAPLPGMEIRVVNSGKPLPAGEEGELQSRGPSHFVGYLKRPDLYNMDAQGWFGTGDLARIDAGGYVRITGRAKDIIIRGGENIPVVEVEQLLYRHPAIQSVAVVGTPDPRLGERGVAFVTLKPGQPFSLDEMRRFLREHQMAPQYFPERLEILDELPLTASGKIQKFRLREIARELKGEWE